MVYSWHLVTTTYKTRNVWQTLRLVGVVCRADIQELLRVVPCCRLEQDMQQQQKHQGARPRTVDSEQRWPCSVWHTLVPGSYITREPVSF
jgi:hypothetical protein